MPDTLRIGLGNTSEKEVQNSDTLTLQKKLKNIGFGDISADILERMSQYKEEYDGFLDDIERISQSNPINQNEKSRIETKYLKGFGQVVNIDGKEYTFYDISKMDSGERRKLQTKIDAIDPDTGEDLKDFLKKLANQRIETKKGVEQAANQEERKLDGNIEAANQRIEVKKGMEQAANQRIEVKTLELIDKDKKLKEQIISFEQIKGIQKGDRDELRNSAIQNPPKELEGADKEKLLRGDYDNILLAAHYVTNAESIGKNITDEADRKKFSDSIISMSDTLGRPRQGSWPEISKGLAFGSSRERIVEAGDRAIAGGYNKSVTWNPETRSLIFKGDKGEKVIETAYNPPRERIVQNRLSITRDIPRITPEQRQRNTLQGELTNLRNSVLRDSQTIELADTKTMPKELENEKGLREYREAQKAFENGANPEEKLLLLKSLKDKNKGLEDIRRSKITTENMSDPGFGLLEESLHKELSSLGKFEESLSKYIETAKKLSKYPPVQPESSFDTIARSNLSWLTMNYFDRMGPYSQGALERIVDGINRDRDVRNQISLSGHELNQEERTALTKSLENLGGTKDVFVDGVKLPTFQNKVTNALMRSPGSPGSIEDISSNSSQGKSGPQ